MLQKIFIEVNPATPVDWKILDLKKPLDWHGGNGYSERNMEEKELLELYDEKEFFVANTLFRKERKKDKGKKTDLEEIIDLALVENDKLIESIWEMLKLFQDICIMHS